MAEHKVEMQITHTFITNNTYPYRVLIETHKAPEHLLPFVFYPNPGYYYHTQVYEGFLTSKDALQWIEEIKQHVHSNINTQSTLPIDIIWETI